MAESHPDLGALSVFLGAWEGVGEGHYPTISPFRYFERVTFDHMESPSSPTSSAPVMLTTAVPYTQRVAICV